MRKRGRKPSKYGAKFWEMLPKSSPTQKPIGEVLESIDQLIKDTFISVRRNDGSEVEVLSTAVRDLPAHMKGLGYYLADADNQVNQAKNDYEYVKLSREKDAIGEAKSVAEAERIAGTDEEVLKAREELRKAQHNHRVLKLQYDATDRQFEGWRSRLSVVKGDLRRAE